ncbi:MAG: helix-turn-helix domain-containing protein [Verrucomicrobiota bacterium]
MQTKQNSQLTPEWADAKAIRTLYGICKSTLYRLADEGKIRTSSLKERGMLRGKRLFSCSSVNAYIEKMASGGEGESS